MRGPPRGFITIYGMVALLGSIILLGLAVLVGLIAGVLVLGAAHHPRRRRGGRALAVGVVPLVAVGCFLMSLADDGAVADSMVVVLFPGAIVAAIVLTVVVARRAEREQRPAGVGAPVAPSLTENAGNAVAIPPPWAERSRSRGENDSQGFRPAEDAVKLPRAVK